VFIKFNTSHNGTSREHPEDFVDLEAYGKNNYTKELYDLQVVIDWALSTNNPHAKNINSHQLYLLGHSRGGGISIIKAAEDARVKAIATWASVSEAKTPWGSWSEEKMKEWKETGVQYYLNGRTQQQMPIYYQLYEDYMNNIDRQNIIKNISSLSIPVLICHGSKDEAVPIAKAFELKEAQPSAELFVVNSDHVFGRKHPWNENNLPGPMQQVVDETLRFYRKVQV
jgi:acetyl esterase/lipase